MRLLKMDKEGAADTYDAFQTTLNPTGIPNRAGIDNLVRSLQAQGRFTDRKVTFAEVADDRLATEVAKELGYKIAVDRAANRAFQTFKLFNRQLIKFIRGAIERIEPFERFATLSKRQGMNASKKRYSL